MESQWNGSDAWHRDQRTISGTTMHVALADCYSPDIFTGATLSMSKTFQEPTQLRSRIATTSLVQGLFSLASVSFGSTIEGDAMTNSTQKMNRLREILLQMQSAVVAYSGGTDSTFLLKVVSDVLGSRVMAVTARSQTYPIGELEEANKNAKRLGVKHMIIETHELDKEEFASNPPDRCYYCKRELYSELWEIAKEYGLNCVLDGSNSDDVHDFRPGARAGKELGVRSPLREAELTKHDIRLLSKRMGLPTWDKPAGACLASRLPYGCRVTPANLHRVAKAEDIIESLGIRQVRVRHHENIARIEVPPADFRKLLTRRASDRVVREIKKLGYQYVTLDIQGYRTGSMNDPLSKSVRLRNGGHPDS